MAGFRARQWNRAGLLPKGCNPASINFLALLGCQELDPSLAGIPDLNERGAELLTLAMLLQPVRKAKRVVQFEALEDVQTTPKNNFPASVSSDITIMLSPCRVIRKRLANTPPRFFQLAAWCPPVFGGHH
ncbi:hypothetical protein, partial [Pseudomonas aeruginosa]|uniref:hypothetical protein n=1 Tax=Pseudomonas aeruginosa TaxID=287 RepID=UPI004038D5F5